MKKGRGVYTVKKGDTLWDISKKIFHDPSKWKTELKKEDGSTFTEEEARKIRTGQAIFYDFPLISHRELLTFTNLVNLEWQFAEIEVNDSKEKGTKDSTSDKEDETQDNNSSIVKKEYKKIVDLLTPESFVRRNDKGEFEKYVYMKDVKKEKEIEKSEKEKGLEEIRMKAGIAMEYLEKWEEWQKSKQSEGTDEGKFLGDWEVIYGADHYKVVADYIDNLYLIATGEKPKPNEAYLTRDKLKKKKSNKIIIQVSLRVIEQAAKITLDIGNSNELNNEKKQIEKVLEKSANKIQDIGIDILRKMDCFVMNLFIDILTNKDSLAGMIKDISGDIAEEVGKKEVGFVNNVVDNIKEEIPEEIIKSLNNILGNSYEEITSDLIREVIKEIAKENEKIKQMNDKDREEKLNDILNKILSEKLIDVLIKNKVFIDFTQELELNETKESKKSKKSRFKVLVLKKGMDIVIVYRREKIENNKILPDEIDLLQIVSSRIIRENPGCRILFTGLEGGADLSFINALIVNDEVQTNSVLFYNNVRNMKEYINFTCEDLDKEYKSSFGLRAWSELDKIKDDLIEKAIYKGITNLLGITSTFSLKEIILDGITGLIGRCIKDSMTKNYYNLLKSMELITNKNNITGYITDIFLQNNYISIPYHFYTHFKGVNAAKINLIDHKLREQATKVVRKPEIGRIISPKLKEKLKIYELYITDDNIEEKREKGFGKIKVKKTDALFLLKVCPDKIRVTDWWDGVIGSTDDWHYALECNEDGEYEIKTGIREYCTDLRNVTLVNSKFYQEVYKMDVFGAKEPFTYFDWNYNNNNKSFYEKYMKQLKRCQELANMMEIIGVIQRSFINKKENAFQVIYPELLKEDKESNIYKPINLAVKINSQMSFDKEVNKEIDVKKTQINEFFFFPYIQKDSGNIIVDKNTNESKVRDEYIESILKSFVAAAVGVGIKDIKYKEKGFEENMINVYLDLEKKEVYEVLHNIVSNMLIEKGVFQSVNKLGDIFRNIELYKQYYEIKNIEKKDCRCSQRLDKLDFSKLLVMHSNFNKSLEYKYNPEDLIVGGKLEIPLKNFPDESSEKSIIWGEENNSTDFVTAAYTLKTDGFTDLDIDQSKYELPEKYIASSSENDKKIGEILGENKKSNSKNFLKNTFNHKDYV